MNTKASIEIILMPSFSATTLKLIGHTKMQLERPPSRFFVLFVLFVVDTITVPPPDFTGNDYGLWISV